jgi:hypothetical protein
MMTARYIRSPDIRVTELDGEGVVLHLVNRRYFTVSESGLVILNALERHQTLDNVVRVLLRTYDVTPDVAMSTASDFLRECESNGMVIREPVA